MRAGIPTSIYNRMTIFLKKPISLKKEKLKNTLRGYTYVDMTLNRLFIFGAIQKEEGVEPKKKDGERK